MIIYKCDVCKDSCKSTDVVVLSNFPRRTYTYAKDSLGVKLVGFPDVTFAETHFCSSCYNKLLNWTCIIQED